MMTTHLQQQYWWGLCTSVQASAKQNQRDQKKRVILYIRVVKLQFGVERKKKKRREKTEQFANSNGRK